MALTLMGPTQEEWVQTATGGLSGAAAGAAIGAQVGSIGGPAGIIGGALLGAGMSYFGASGQTKARKSALKETAKVRRISAMQEMGARQQAENIAMGGLVRPQNSGNMLSGQGFIGQNLPTNAGTF
jgi:hypothetical protein